MTDHEWSISHFDIGDASKRLADAGFKVSGWMNRKPMFSSPLSLDEWEDVEKIVKGEKVIEPAPPVPTPPPKPVKAKLTPVKSVARGKAKKR